MPDVSQVVEFVRLTAGATSEPVSSSKASGRPRAQVPASALLTFLPAIKAINNTVIDVIPNFIDAGGPNSTFSVIMNGGSPFTIASRIINGGTF